MIGRMSTESAQSLLSAWRARESLSLTQAGKRLGVSGPTVLDWERGRKRPRAALRKVIEIITSIDPDLWDTDAERAAIAQARTPSPAKGQRQVAVRGRGPVRVSAPHETRAAS